MVKNRTKIATIALLVTLMGTASAYVNFGVSFGNYCPAPCYPVYAPVCYRPSLGIGFGGPNFGVGFEIPLSPRRVEVVRHVEVINSCKLDDQDKSYWRIFNRTNFDVTVMNANGRQVTIMPGDSEKLSHKDSFKFRVKADGDHFSGKSSCHNLIIKYDNQMDELYYTEQ